MRVPSSTRFSLLTLTPTEFIYFSKTKLSDTFFFKDRVSCSPDWPQTHCGSSWISGSYSSISEYWGFRCALPYLIMCCAGNRTQHLLRTKQALYRLSYTLRPPNDHRLAASRILIQRSTITTISRCVHVGKTDTLRLLNTPPPGPYGPSSSGPGATIPHSDS